MARILIVDDKKFILDITKRLLKEIRHDVEVASSATEALEILNNDTNMFPFDLIISDIDMPGINGFEFWEILRQMNIKIPIIAYSGGMYDSEIEIALENNVIQGSLSKPSSLKEFTNILNELDIIPEFPDF
jgi:CheY-like chemotaxis protein